MTLTGGGAGVIDGRGFRWWETAVYNAVTRAKGWRDNRPNIIGGGNIQLIIDDTLVCSRGFDSRARLSLKMTFPKFVFSYTTTGVCGDEQLDRRRSDEARVDVNRERGGCE